jgi:hypothetical protein
LRCNRLCWTTDVSVFTIVCNSAGGRWAVKLDSTGNVRWSNPTQIDSAFDLAAGVGGGALILNLASGSGDDIRLYGLDSSATTVWVEQFWWPENQIPVALEWLADSSYIVVATTNTIGQPRDILLIKTEPVLTLSAGMSLTPVPTSFVLLAYPNPFNPSTTISFSLPRTSNVSLAVYDITGRKVETLLDKSLNAGEHSIDFNGSALPSGLYFARLTAGDFSQTQKMVLLK